RMSYCDYNYDLLGDMVRRVSTRTLADAAAERIFQPLGMADTYFVVPEHCGAASRAGGRRRRPIRLRTPGITKPASSRRPRGQAAAPSRRRWIWRSSV